MDLVMEERPDIRAEQKGYESLTTIELLSLIMGGSDTATITAARAIFKLADCKTARLMHLNKKELRSIPNVGSARANAILASFEMSKRITMATPESEDLGSARAIYDFMHPKMQWLEYEEFWILLMNQNLKLIKPVRISHGGLTETAVDIRVIMKEALLNNATVLAACHNHPSGNSRPSRQDDNITERMRKACDTMRIHFLDHIIVTNGNYYSYEESGRL